MSSIYQLTVEAQEIASLLSENELTEEIENALTINQDQLQKKAIDYGFVIKSFESDISTIDNEIERLKGLKTKRSNAINRMKEAVLEAMQVYGIEKVESPTLKLSIRKNPESVFIVNEYQIAKKYKKTVKTISIDKNKIKDDLKNGVKLRGAILIQKERVDIK